MLKCLKEKEKFNTKKVKLKDCEIRISFIKKLFKINNNLLINLNNVNKTLSRFTDGNGNCSDK